MSNNAFASLDVNPFEEPREDKSKYREREQWLLQVVGALQNVEKTKEWSTLKTEVFENLVNSLEKELKDEARKDNPDTNKLNRIVGKLSWAEKYADLSKLAQSYRPELQSIRLQLYGKSESNG